MGYFPNGLSGEAYEEIYCNRCVHQKPDDGGCPVFLLHLLHNYDENEKPDSFLHVLIPREENGVHNKECEMFWPKDSGLAGQPS